MNENSTSGFSKNNSRTDWERLDALTDEEIDTDDSPPLADEFFAKAQWLLPGEASPRRPVKVELELDPKILTWFQSQGQDYERRMLAALRLYAEAHQGEGVGRK